MKTVDGGFIFNINRCVACGACSAACIIENKWKVRPRSILTFNSEALPGLPLFNVSIACNHCGKALCLEGCPASAYSRDESTNAVIIDDSKCLGCRYCQWNCPYDAPKFDSESRVIGKCNFCNQLISDGMNPACASACPTGALSFGRLPDISRTFKHLNNTDRKMQPALSIAGTGTDEALRIEPSSRFSRTITGKNGSEKSLNTEWSLIIFTFISAVSVAFLASSVLSGTDPDPLRMIMLLAAAASSSLFHLGRPLRAWRALLNLRTSPLSREILCFLVFAVLTSAAVLVHSPVLMAVAAVTGLLLLLLIDSIYYYSDPEISTFMHSGQTLLTALLISSFLTGELIAFLFIAALRLVLSVIKYVNSEGYISLRFARAGVLIVTSLYLIGNSASYDSLIFIILLAGELCDRILFYVDFSPFNFASVIRKTKPY